MLNLAFQTVESLRTEMDPTANVKHFFTLWRWQNHLTAHTRNISILWCGFSRVLPMEYTHFFDNHYPVGFRILKKGGQLLNPEVYRILFCLESSVFKRNPGFLAQTKKNRYHKAPMPRKISYVTQVAPQHYPAFHMCKRKFMAPKMSCVVKVLSGLFI